PSGHGHEFLAGVIESWVRNLVLLKIRRVEDFSSVVVLVTILVQNCEVRHANSKGCGSPVAAKVSDHGRHAMSSELQCH
ncbi:hypothetical protein TNCV_4968681, partial [Trichonephila clavipes]